MYDWANSVYSLVISTVLFPLYYEAVTKNETNEVLFLGRYWENTVVYSYVIAASYLTISILLYPKQFLLALILTPFYKD